MNHILARIAIRRPLLLSWLAPEPRRSRAASPNPLDAVPDKMPFDIPYGAPISLERAQAADRRRGRRSRRSTTGR